ncbi:hypothetical protein [Cellulomonas sp. URHD0024]|uniref:hypothetical protein n=1 Tax=Cellulomonas sp. URHD0024 TaxID=1302620 RepID=UPI000407F476|nr:hypothetical protein [Cellulomonas sp. URHD0024]
MRAPFTAAGDAADSIAEAGVQVQHGANQLALVLGLTVAVVPILLVVAVWLSVRLRFVRRARAARRTLDSTADLDLFALRALATQPVEVLAGVSDDPADGWRRRDPGVVRALASLELRSLGLRVPIRHTPSWPQDGSRPRLEPSLSRLGASVRPCLHALPPST